MKQLHKTLIAFAAIFYCYTTEAQTLFTFGNKQVSKEEFLRAFNKNNAETKPTGKAYRDYLELYTRFKIKVQSAMDAGMDTLPSQVAELKNFRNQVSSSYMNDEASVNMLTDEAIGRSARDIELSHILVLFPKDDASEGRQSALNKINLAYERLSKGESFAKVAEELSEDPAAKGNKGYLGYITAFTLPYEMENVAYNTAPGKFSKPFKSNIGYHIFKVNSQRNSAGRMKAAQILLAYPPQATSAELQQVATRADSIYKAILAGADFKKLAARYSNDNLSYQNGGEMQEFGTGRYEPAFEKAAFALKTNGAVSKPFTTEYGVHILKRLDWKPLQLDKKNKAVLENFHQQVLQSDRMNVSRKLLLKKIYSQVGVKRISVDEVALAKLKDSFLYNGSIPVQATIKETTPLVTIGRQNLTVADFLQYLEAIRTQEGLHKGKSADELVDQYAETAAMEYYRNHLEEYNKDFAYQLNEFKEGNLLFEVMQQKIWEAASADSAGLKNYYEQHRNKYWWEMSADAWIITASNDSIARTFIEKSNSDPKFDWRKAIDLSEGAIQGDSGRFELGQLPVRERTAFRAGLITAPVVNETDHTATFCHVLKMYNAREPRGFNDARGFVINDYQGFLEEKWIAELKKKYPVKVNEAVFNSLIKK